MNQIPAFKPQKLMKILRKMGFEKIRQEGSHIFYKHTDGRTTVIPFHKSKDIGRGLLRAIIFDLQIKPKDLLKYL